MKQGKHTCFWYASCLDADVRQKHAAGFDDYPLAQIPANLFFFERVLGCNIRCCSDVSDSRFHSWCKPLIKDAREACQLQVDLETNEGWNHYVEAARTSTTTVGTEGLAVPIPRFCPLDWLCNVCGAEQLFIFMLDAPPETQHLIDIISPIYLRMWRQLRKLGVRSVSSCGFPCVFINDLQLANLSPVLIESYVLPQYERIAQECGGMVLRHSNKTIADHHTTPSFLRRQESRLSTTESC